MGLDLIAIAARSRLKQFDQRLPFDDARKRHSRAAGGLSRVEHAKPLSVKTVLDTINTACVDCAHAHSLARDRAVDRLDTRQRVRLDQDGSSASPQLRRLLEEMHLRPSLGQAVRQEHAADARARDEHLERPLLRDHVRVVRLQRPIERRHPRGREAGNPVNPARRRREGGGHARGHLHVGGARCDDLATQLQSGEQQQRRGERQREPAPSH
mmetsp:Transcript_44310/g.109715  ORF Transcript_44310/g.109715 Transcript_44310/m.109715 type:complete len:212 (+) Transcript_44310:1312-1947(+)